MIKVNLLPVKKKKKAKPLPTFLIVTVAVTIAAIALMAYLNYFFASRVTARQALVAENDRRIEELAKKIKTVEDYEKRNADYQKRKDVIEQLGKNKTLPVRIFDEISSVLSSGVWINSMSISGADVSMTCTGFSNTDVVNFVNNMKASKLFTDVYLQESVQATVSGYSVYNFRITCKAKA